MNLRDLRRPILRWAMGWPGNSTGLGPPRLPPAKMVEVARESKREIPELIPVHPAGKIYRKKPAIPIGCEPHPAFNIPEAPQTPTYLARVPQGRVVGPTVAVLTSADRMLSDVSLDWGRPGLEHFAYRRLRLPRCQDFQGSALVLACTGSDTYFHWLTDSLPRLEIASRAKGETWRPDYWVVNTMDRPFIRESLSLLKIPLKKVIPLDRNPHIRFAELWVPSLPCESSSGDSPIWVMRYLQNAWTNIIKDNRQEQFPKYFWIDRPSSKARRMVLSEENKDLLKSFSFSILRLETLPFSHQVSLFNRAEMVAGPHGAGFSNLVFSSNAKVFELFTLDYVNPCYYSLGDYNKNDYFYCTAAQTASGNLRVDLKSLLNSFR